MQTAIVSSSYDTAKYPSRWRLVRHLLAHPGLLWEVVNGALQLRGAVEFPPSVHVQGRVTLGGGGQITIGRRTRITGTMVPVELSAWPGATLSIGERARINYGASIAAVEAVAIGDDCYIGPYTIINDNDYHDVENKASIPPSKPVVLEDRVWLGARVIVLKGVRIGHDAVIGAGSVVLRDVPPRTVSLGNPARVVRQF